MPSYTLCPDIRIAGIVAEIGAGDREDSRAGRRPDPSDWPFGWRASGGAHGLRRSPLADAVLARIGNVVSISGVHDLRPLMRTAMNATLEHRSAEAAAESPALLEPIDGARVTCWVGGGERAEFIRQSALLANAWVGLGAATAFSRNPTGTTSTSSTGSPIRPIP